MIFGASPFILMVSQGLSLKYVFNLIDYLFQNILMY